MFFCICYGFFFILVQLFKYIDMQVIVVVVNFDIVDCGDSVDQQVILFQFFFNGILGFDQVQFNGDYGDFSKQNEDGVIGYYVNFFKMVFIFKFGFSLVIVVLDDVVSFGFRSDEK